MAAHAGDDDATDIRPRDRVGRLLPPTVGSSVSIDIAQGAPDEVEEAPLKEATVGSRMRRWTFTAYHETDDIEALKACIEPCDLTSYIVFQIEKCPETERPHAQGYLELNDNCRLTRVKGLFADPFKRRIHLKDAYKSSLANTRYCTKEFNSCGKCKPGHLGSCGNSKCGTKARWPGLEEFVFKHGEPSGYGDKGGRDKDTSPFDQVVEQLIAGKRLRAIEDDPETDIKMRSQITRNFNKLHELEMRLMERDVPRFRQVYVEVINGPPGTGKSHLTMNRWLGEDIYRKTEGMGDWFEGYKGQKVLVLDDFDGSWMSAAKLMQIMDGYILRLPIKGTHAIALWVHVVIVSNLDVRDWWNFRTCQSTGLPCVCSLAQMQAIESRICEVKYITGEDKRPMHRAAPFPPNNPDYQGE